MRIVPRRCLKEFAERFPDAEGQLDAWYLEVKNEQWRTPADIKAKYRSASILKSSRVVFNLCGNKYRIVVKISYPNGVVRIRFIGTHREYDKINAEEV